jgi:mRNA interferase HigB
MNLVGLPLLLEFGRKHPDARDALLAWRTEVEKLLWGTPAQLKDRFPKASIIDSNNVVFDIRHNRYRLHVKISYVTKTVVIVRLGTHDEYSKWTYD